MNQPSDQIRSDQSLSRVRLLATPWTAAYQAPPSMGFSRQEYWSGVPLPSPTYIDYSSDQMRSVAQSCPTLCDPMNRSTPGLPVHHQPPELTQTHVHRVSDAIQPSHPLSSPSPLLLMKERNVLRLRKWHQASDP